MIGDGLMMISWDLTILNGYSCPMKSVGFVGDSVLLCLAVSSDLLWAVSKLGSPIIRWLILNLWCRWFFNFDPYHMLIFLFIFEYDPTWVIIFRALKPPTRFEWMGTHSIWIRYHGNSLRFQCTYVSLGTCSRAFQQLELGYYNALKWKECGIQTTRFNVQVPDD